MNVLVSGGGIAGLTLALTCDQIGVPVEVVEALGELTPLGLGINVHPEAVRELIELGLEAPLATIGIETLEFALFDARGREVWSEPRGRAAGSRWPQYSIHRGELHMLLYRSAVERLGADAIRTGQRATRYEHAVDGVRLEVTTGEGRIERIDGSVLVGADGLHSTVRAQMFPGDGGPRWGGSVLWRGSALHEPIRTGGSFVVAGDTTQRFVTFPMAPPDPDTGLQLQNWIAEMTFDPTRGWRRGDWNTRVSVDEFVGAFDDWRFDWLDVPDLIRSSEEVFEYPMVDRDPVDHWTHGSVALLGDAAHAMYPVGSNGASQAIVDARVLGAAFLEHGVGRDALHAYESALLPARSALVLRNRALGPGSVLGTVDSALATAFGDLTAATTEQREQLISRYRSMAAAATRAANAEPSTILLPDG